MSGATGAIYGIRLLEALRQNPQVETHLVLSRWAEETITLETEYRVDQVRKLAHHCYNVTDVGAPIASGSFLAAGMVIIPCSMKTVAAVAHGYADNLIVRAADVMLKERRRLILVARETPLNEIHLQNMLRLTRAGAIIVPPVPAFYNHPQSIDDLVNHLVGRVLDLLDIPNSLSRRWGEGKFKLRTGTGSKVREQTDNSLSPGARGASMRRLVCKVREEQVEP